jgi:nitroimidazol reductase NimA-like FMN-containing flavoprotein (pyridoxamine 5'-phosphate oxidase superfamily)
METKVDKRTGLEVLDRAECLALVRPSVIGRFAVSVDNRPLVFPVNFVLDGDTVVFRTNDGTKLWAARRAPVVFECDGIDPLYHTGWSVMIAGRVEEILNPIERARVARLPLTPWCQGDKPVWLRLRPHSITGRRIPAHGAEPCTP